MFIYLAPVISPRLMITKVFVQQKKMRENSEHKFLRENLITFSYCDILRAHLENGMLCLLGLPRSPLKICWGPGIMVVKVQTGSDYHKR